MNTFITNVYQNIANVVTRYTFACRNYSYHSFTSDYVRHRTLSKDISRPYLVARNDIRLPRSFYGVLGDSFSTNEVIV